MKVIYHCESALTDYMKSRTAAGKFRDDTVWGKGEPGIMGGGQLKSAQQPGHDPLPPSSDGILPVKAWRDPCVTGLVTCLRCMAHILAGRSMKSVPRGQLSLDLGIVGKPA